MHEKSWYQWQCVSHWFTIISQWATHDHNIYSYLLFNRQIEKCLTVKQVTCSTSLHSDKPSVLRVYVFLAGSRALFRGPASTEFSKIKFKTKSHGTIHTFKNYFATVFSVFGNKLYPNRLLVWLVKLGTPPLYCFSARDTWIPMNQLQYLS